MRKWTTMFLTLLLVVCCTVPACAAGGIDLTAMTLEELQELVQNVNAEIESRTGMRTSNISPGVLTAGIGIKPGTYTFTCVETYSGAESVTVNIFPSMDDYTAYESFNDLNDMFGDDDYGSLASVYLTSSAELKVGESTTIQLTDGMVLELSNGTGELVPVVQSWAIN